MQRKIASKAMQGSSKIHEQIRRQVTATTVPKLQADFETTLNRAKGGGAPLDNAFRAKVEPVMGADFSSVRVHTDSRADQLSRAIQAKAFTTGQDVFFRQGAYEPESRKGQELIAHELTHVVQQRGGMRSEMSRNKMLQDRTINTAIMRKKIHGAVEVGAGCTNTTIRTILTGENVGPTPKGNKDALNQLFGLFFNKANNLTFMAAHIIPKSLGGKGNEDNVVPWPEEFEKRWTAIENGNKKLMEKIEDGDRFVYYVWAEVDQERQFVKWADEAITTIKNQNYPWGQNEYENKWNRLKAQLKKVPISAGMEVLWEGRGGRVKGTTVFRETEILPIHLLNEGLFDNEQNLEMGNFFDEF